MSDSETASSALLGKRTRSDSPGPSTRNGNGSEPPSGDVVDDDDAEVGPMPGGDEDEDEEVGPVLDSGASRRKKTKKKAGEFRCGISSLSRLGTP